jgi:hypothetical protein
VVRNYIDWVLALPWYHSAQCFAGLDPALTSRLRWQFYGQWLVVASFTYFGFIRPVLDLRRRLVRERSHLLRDRIPQIESEIAQLKGALPGTAGAEGRKALETRIHDLAREHWAIRNMSCWPMDRTTFHKYAPVEIVSNVAPVLAGPLMSFNEAQSAAQVPMLSGFAGGIASFLKALFL